MGLDARAKLAICRPVTKDLSGSVGNGSSESIDESVGQEPIVKKLGPIIFPIPILMTSLQACSRFSSFELSLQQTAASQRQNLTAWTYRIRLDNKDRLLGS